MRQRGACSVWSATWTVCDADGNKKHEFLVTVRRVPEEGAEGTHLKQKRRKKTAINCQRKEAWRAFLLELPTSKSSFVRIRLPRGLPHAVASHVPIFFRRRSQNRRVRSFHVSTISGNETRMARNCAPAFDFNNLMDEDHFPPLCMLHAQKAQLAEQRQMDAAMKASKKAYDAQKAMLDIETKAVSPATTVGHFSSDDALSGLSSDGNESSGSESRRYRFVVAICCCRLGSILCIHAAKYTHRS